MNIEGLPEECIAHVIARTSPRDACRSAAVSTTINSAAASDAIWKRFLPPDCDAILSRAVRHVEYDTRKELYFRLCDRPVLIDGGGMSFALERTTGAKCYMLSARRLNIVWGGNPSYWGWIHLPDSRFSEVAELLNVCWLDIRGNIESVLLSRKTTYAAYLIYNLSEESYGLHQPLQEATVTVGAQLSRGMVQLQELPHRGWDAQLMNPINREVDANARIHRKTPRRRGDGWMEMELGEFYNDEGEDGEAEIILREVNGGNWKKGLLIQGIEIRIKSNE